MMFHRSRFTPKEKVGLVVAGLLFASGVAIMLWRHSWATFYGPVFAVGVVWSVLSSARDRDRRRVSNRRSGE